MPRKTIDHRRTERQCNRSGQHPQEPDQPDRGGAASSIRPHRQGQQRHPLNGEEPAPRQLEPPQLTITKDAANRNDLIGKRMSKTLDPSILSLRRRNATSLEPC
jgi:hypothetical protein